MGLRSFYHRNRLRPFRRAMKRKHLSSSRRSFSNLDGAVSTINHPVQKLRIGVGPFLGTRRLLQDPVDVDNELAEGRVL